MDTKNLYKEMEKLHGANKIAGMTTEQLKFLRDVGEMCNKFEQEAKAWNIS